MTAEVRSYEPEDKARVEDLRRSTFGGSFLYQDFEWRNLRPPTETWLWVAELDDEIIFFHSHVARPIHLGNGVVMPAATGGDAVVAAEQRNKGLGRQLMTEARSRVYSKTGPPIGMAWAAKRLARRFYIPAYNYCPTPAGTLRLEKLLSWEHLDTETTTEAEVVASVRFGDLPILQVLVGAGSTAYSLDERLRPDVTATIKPRALATFRRRGGRRSVELARALVMGDLRVGMRFGRWKSIARDLTKLVDAVASALGS